MGELYKKKNSDTKSEAELSAEAADIEISKARATDGSKRIRKLNPLGMRVVVQIKRDTNMTDGGLYLPEGAKQSLSESLLAQVVEVASAIDRHTEEESNISGIPLGSLVLILKNAGVKVPWNEDLRIVETKEVLAVVNEVDIV